MICCTRPVESMEKLVAAWRSWWLLCFGFIFDLRLTGRSCFDEICGVLGQFLGMIMIMYHARA